MVYRHVLGLGNALENLRQIELLLRLKVLLSANPPS